MPSAQRSGTPVFSHTNVQGSRGLNHRVFKVSVSGIVIMVLGRSLIKLGTWTLRGMSKTEAQRHA